MKQEGWVGDRRDPGKSQRFLECLKISNHQVQAHNEFPCLLSSPTRWQILVCAGDFAPLSLSSLLLKWCSFIILLTAPSHTCKLACFFTWLFDWLSLIYLATPEIRLMTHLEDSPSFVGSRVACEGSMLGVDLSMKLVHSAPLLLLYWKLTPLLTQQSQRSHARHLDETPGHCLHHHNCHPPIFPTPSWVQQDPTTKTWLSRHRLPLPHQFPMVSPCCAFLFTIQHLIQSNPNNISSLHILIHYSLAHQFPPRIMPTLNISIPCHQHKLPQAQGQLCYSHPLSSLPPPLLPSTFSPLATYYCRAVG